MLTIKNIVSCHFICGFAIIIVLFASVGCCKNTVAHGSKQKLLKDYDNSIKFEEYKNTVKKLNAAASPYNGRIEWLQKDLSDELLIAYLKNDLNHYLGIAKRQPLIRTRIYAWQCAYLLEGSVNLYEITKNVEYLNIVKRFYDHIIPLRDSNIGYYDEFTGNSHPTWGAESWGYWQTNITWSGRLAYPAIKMAYWYKIDRLHTSGENPDYYIDIMEKALLSHRGEYIQLEKSAGYYNRYSGYLEAFNHLPSIIASYIYLGKLKNVKYEQKAINLAALLLDSIHFRRDGTCWWGYAWASGSRFQYDKSALKPEPIWKAHETIQIFRHLRDNQLLFDSKLYSCVASSFLKNIYLGDNSQDGHIIMSPYIAPRKPNHYDFYNMPRKYSAYTSWILFADQFPEINRIILRLIAENSKDFPYLWLSSPVSFRAYTMWRKLQQQ